jgi:DNA-binding MarR family transcriptional regulator
MTGVRWLSDEEQATWRAFLEASQLLFETLDRELQDDAGMPHGYYEILVRLSEAPERRLRSRISHAIGRLEEMGWVVRHACATDRRGSYAELTDTGFRALEAAAPGHVEGVRTHLFDQLDPKDVQTLHRISDQLNRHLEEVDPTSTNRGREGP